VTLGIVAVLIGLLIPAVQSVRATSLQTRSMNNLRQIILGMYAGAEAERELFKGRLGGFAKARYSSQQERSNAIINDELQFNPHITVLLGIEERTADNKRLRTQLIPYLLSPADPTLVGRDWTNPSHMPHATIMPDTGGLEFGMGGPTSYAFNMIGFLGPARPNSISDGTTNTIAFAEKYFETRKISNYPYPMKSWMVFGMHTPAFDSKVPGHLDNLNERRPSFADEGWGDVLPVTVNGVSRPSIEGMTFQSRPRMEQADMRICQTPHRGGLPVAMFDGSVRVIGAAVAPEAFWGAVTSNANDSVNLD
jgi:prepilin-type processing-associated H-X9-DG protein